MFDLKQRCAEWSLCDIKVPREWWESSRILCIRIALAVISCTDYSTALDGADCLYCERLPLRMLRSRKALFKEGAFTSVSHGAAPAFAKAECSWESQMHQMEGMKMGEPLYTSFLIRSSARSLGLEARPAVSSLWRKGSALRLSSSEEVDVEDAMSFCKAYCLLKHVVNEYHYKGSGAQSALERKKEGMIVLFPASIHSDPAGHTPRSVSVPVFS